MSKKLTVVIVTAAVSILYLLTWFPTVAAPAHFEAFQTIPTATPSSGTDPTQPPPPPPDDDDDPPPATVTSSPQNTATATVAAVTTVATTATAGATSTDGTLATAEPCAPSPTFLSLARINVRGGPGTNYEIIDGLNALEVRRIVGRAAYSQWWLIDLRDGSRGWVANQTGTVNGYIGLIPVVDAPTIGNATPTPGATWEPTPNPMCTVTPTATATRESTATSVPTATSARSTTAAEFLISETATTEPTASPKATSSPTETTAPEPEPTATPAPIAGTEPVEESNWLLYGGIGLVVAGLVFSAIRRRER